MEYRAYMTSHGGNVRTNNEDNAYLEGFYREDDTIFSWSHEVNTRASLLAAVFDGMGGIANGEIASRIAAEEMHKRKGQLFSEILASYVQETNTLIRNHSTKANMGTTYAAVSMNEKGYHFSNLGDSRGYLFRNGKLMQTTKDHNMVQELYLCGVLTEEQAKRHPNRHAIYQFLGMPEEDGEDMILEPYVSIVEEVQENDICLLCSDGLTDMLSDSEIEDVLSGNGTIGEKAEELKQCALNNGGKDNITIILVEVFL